MTRGRRSLRDRLSSLVNNRWLVLVAAIWVMSCSGVGYMFGSISPVIKSSLNYNQKQLAKLGVAKDLGGSVGFLAGALCEVLPLWGVLLLGALHDVVGYGWVWLVVTGRTPVLPLWAMCILIFVASNGETYFNTASLVSCVQNFPTSRGPVVGILKGFSGLGGAILTQIYAVIHAPDQASLIFMVAVGPAMVIISLMFFIRPVEGHGQVRTTDAASFTFIYSVCLLLAAYLMGVMLVEDLITLTYKVIVVFTIILLIILLVPILIPLSLSCCSEPIDPVEEVLLPKQQEQEVGKTEQEGQEVILREVEDCTLMQALMKADFWLIFFSMLLGSGSGLTVVDNLGQMSQSIGYENAHVFVSMFSIWNFLGRIGGGYFSEIVVRDHAHPRPIVLAVAQLVMAVGHVFFAFMWPGAMYIGTLLVGLGYGAHWGIMPATASELFGLKLFGALYNFLTLANPAGSLVFSGVIASSLYDREAERQAHGEHLNSRSVLPFFGLLASDEPLKCKGAICFFLSSLIMSGFCIIAVVLSMILVRRTKTVYARLYGRRNV